MMVQVITYGARVVSLSAPDRHGKMSDVLLGCDNVAGQICFLINIIHPKHMQSCYTHVFPCADVRVVNF